MEHHILEEEAEPESAIEDSKRRELGRKVVRRRCKS